MFSPEATVQSARGSLRNPRRRQRKDSDGLQQQPRRKRSKISEDTFNSPDDGFVNGKSSARMNGHAVNGDMEGSGVMVDMPVREKKPAPKRAFQEDTSMYLTKTVNYGVKKLQSFPPRLAASSPPFRAFTLPSAGLALALTSEHAFAWDYTSIGGPTKVITLPLSFNLKPSDPLPLGAIVRNGPTNDFGVLAIAPLTGNITFWDNVDSAETRSHFPQRHKGISGVVSKMYSGEVITGLVDVEHAGYVIIFSSGRLAQLILRDSQGRPNITVNYMNTPTGSNGSFFSFRSFLGSSIKKSMASVKARPSESKGQMEVVTATKNCVFQLWDLTWTGQHIFKGEVDIHSDILAALDGHVGPEHHRHRDALLLDFAILEQHRTPETVSVIALVALSGPNSLEYSLLEVDLTNHAGSVRRAIPIQNFQQAQLPKGPTGTLLIPGRGHTAFVQFPGAIFLTSLVAPEQSPDTQLMSDSGETPLPFQDTIYFQNDNQLQICGTAIDPLSKKDKHSAIVVFVQGYGIVQVLAKQPAPDSSDEDRLKVTAKSKLEEATLFSLYPENIIDFSIKSRYSFAQEDVENAALDISTGIMSSSYASLERVSSTMEEQIRRRCFALRNLMVHLKSYDLPISFTTRWRLLWHAEKLAAALQLWNVHQARLHATDHHPESDRDLPLIPILVKMVHERYKTKLNPEVGETDPVRSYFAKDISGLEIALHFGWQLLRVFYLDDEENRRPALMQRLSEVNDAILAALETAFNFRIENMEFYGLDPESLYEGVLKEDQGYDKLPSFWTSSYNLMTAVRALVDVGRQLAYHSFENSIEPDLAKKIAKDNPRLVKVCCQMFLERARHCSSQSDERKKGTGETLMKEFNEHVRPEQIYGLVDIGMATEGMRLAEIYRDMPTLVRLVWDEMQFLEESKAQAQSKMEEAECTVKINRMRERIRRYFEDYGDAWADAFYSMHVQEHQAGRLFSKEYMNRAALTKWLRADPSRARLRWINEVSGERNYEAAGEALLEVAMNQETNAWCKKGELSLGKLAMLCKHQGNPASTEPEKVWKSKGVDIEEDGQVQDVTNQLEYAKVQDLVFDRLSPTIAGALDDDSALDLVMAEFGQGRLTERPALQQLLQQGFDALIHSRVIEPALLIDVLTLMNNEDCPRTDIMRSGKFVLALKALSLSWDHMHKTSRESLVKLIWKRISIDDDWAHINNTSNMSDAEVNNYLAQTSLAIAYQGILRLVLIVHDSYKRVWPREPRKNQGAGCKDSDLCVRFPTEDLRRPIIRDNLADDEIFTDYLNKSRYEQWFEAAANAAQKIVRREVYSYGGTAEGNGLMADLDDQASVEGEEPPSDPPASEAFQGDDEQSVVGQDVAMADA